MNGLHLSLSFAMLATDESPRSCSTWRKCFVYFTVAILLIVGIVLLVLGADYNNNGMVIGGIMCFAAMLVSVGLAQCTCDE